MDDQPQPQMTEKLVDAVADAVPERCTRWKWLGRLLTSILHFIITLPLFLVMIIPVIVVSIVKFILLVSGQLAPAMIPSDKYDVPRVFFDGAGWALYFALGVMQHIRENYDLSGAEIYAISSGNFSAIGMLLEDEPRELLQRYYPVLRQHVLFSPFENPLCGFCSRLGFISQLLDELLPDDFHKKASGRIHILICSWPSLSVKCINNFSSNQEFIDAVVCSMGLPGFICFPQIIFHATWAGLWVDGGLGNFFTPLWPLVDCSVRTIQDPLNRVRRSDILPPAEWKLDTKAFWPATTEAFFEGMDRGMRFAQGHPALAGLEKYRKPRVDV